MPKLTIDGKEIEVPAGTTIIQAAEKLGINIPRYCYHPALPVSGNCRICLVEVEKQPKLQIACYTPVAEGMVVKTTSQKTLDTRKTVLEFLLVNHPVDCPVCDQAGECKLQDYYMEHGQYNSRLVDVKIKKHKKAFSIGPTVMLDQERCILCTRCVRFSEHVTKTNELGVFNRGDHSELDVVPGMQLDNKYSGNVVDICPVGALTDKDFRFKCRVWYLGETKSVCPGCSMGCNINIHWDKQRPRVEKTARVMRLKPRLNPDVNQYWICDSGRYNYRFIDEKRVMYPQMNNELVTWDKALDAVAHALDQTHKKGLSAKIGIIASAQLTNEDLFAVRKLFKDTLKLSNVDFQVLQKSGDSDDFLIKADKNPNTAGAKTILQSLAGQDATQILDKAKRGEIDVLYVFGHDLVSLYGKQTVVEIAKHVKTFIWQGTNINETCSYAHIILPSAVYAEKEGTFTNVQKRVQRIWPAFLPLADSKADWDILNLLSKKLGHDMKFTSSEKVFTELSSAVAVFSEMSYEKLGEHGLILKS